MSRQGIPRTRAARALAVVVAAIVALGAARAQEGGAPPDAEVLRAIAALSDPDFEVREAATSTILAKGEAARATLEQALPELRLEARLRVEAILARLSRPRVVTARFDEATLVDAVFEDTPLRVAAARLALDGNCRIRLGPNNEGAGPAARDPRWDRPVRLELRRVPFLQALDALCAAAGLSCNRDYMSGDFLLADGNQDQGIVRYVGPFRVALTGINITHSSRFSGPSTVSAALQVRVDFEDGVDVVGLVHPLRIPPVRDDQDREVTFPVFQTRTPFLLPVDRRRQFFLNATMDAPARDAKLLRDLVIPFDAVVPEEIAAGETPWAVTPAESERAPGDVVDLRVVSIQEAGAQRNVTVSLVIPAVEGSVALQQPPRWEEFTAVDAKGGVAAGQVIGQQGAEAGRERRILQFPAGDYVAIRARLLARHAMKRLEARFEEVPLP